MKTDEALRTLARRLFRARRIMVYVNLINSAMLVALFLDRFGWVWAVAAGCGGIVSLVVVHWFDVRYGVPMEGHVMLKDNPTWVSLVDAVERIERKLR